MEKKISDLLDCIQDDNVHFHTKDVASLERIKELSMKKADNINITNATIQRRTRKKLTILIAAVLVTMLFAGAAFAAVQSIFSSMAGMYIGDDPAKYEMIDAHSNKEEESVKGALLVTVRVLPLFVTLRPSLETTLYPDKTPVVSVIVKLNVPVLEL